MRRGAVAAWDRTAEEVAGACERAAVVAPSRNKDEAVRRNAGRSRKGKGDFSISCSLAGAGMGRPGMTKIRVII